MKSKKTAYFCSECGYESPKWLGRCPACQQWNTFIEQPLPAKDSKTGKNSLRTGNAPESNPVRISEISYKEEVRINMPSSEFNRVLGGGLVRGSLTLIGGEPGIGKSTLLLQNILLSLIHI